MARTKSGAGGKAPSGKKAAAAAAPKDSGSRPLNALHALFFLGASLAMVWYLRVEPGLAGVPVDFESQVERAQFSNGTPLRTEYSGVKALDDVARFLVVAFYAGPAGWDEGVRLQQIHFLVNFFAVICVWNVEACRVRNSWKSVSFTALFAVFYQTVGGAIIIPLYYFFHVRVSSQDAYFSSGRAVPLPYARTLLLAATLGYLVPTIALYVPGISTETRQLLTMVWQPSPLFVNALLLVFSFVAGFFGGGATSGSGSKTADVGYLKGIYKAAAAVTAITHFGTLYVCYTSSDPELSFSHVFIPDASNWSDSTTLGLHYIFQVDWWGIFIPTLAWAWIGIYDVLRLQANGKPLGIASLSISAGAVVLLGVLVGPGAALALSWNWREDKLAMLEESRDTIVRKSKAT